VSLYKKSDVVRNFLYYNPGVSYDTISFNLNISVVEVWEIVNSFTDYEKKFIFMEDQTTLENLQEHINNKWNQEKTIEALQEAATYAYPLSQAKYNELRLIGEIDAPMVRTIIRKMGSWQNACEIAGIEAAQSNSDPSLLSSSPWTDDDCLKFVCEYLEDPKIFTTKKNDFDQWLKANKEEYPSVRRIMKSLGTWKEARIRGFQKIADKRREEATGKGIDYRVPHSLQSHDQEVESIENNVPADMRIYFSITGQDFVVGEQKTSSDRSFWRYESELAPLSKNLPSEITINNKTLKLEAASNKRGVIKPFSKAREIKSSFYIDHMEISVNFRITKMRKGMWYMWLTAAEKRY